MKKYDVFISYRKKTVAYADLLYYSLISEGINKDRIFLDKHTIGPEQFDVIIKQAIEQSNCLIMIVSTNCFQPKCAEDWFLEEIDVALKSKIRIIPVLFDAINSLEDDIVLPLLNKNYSEDDVKYLVHQQAVRYDQDYSQASMDKLSSFVIQSIRKEKLTIIEFMTRKFVSGVGVFTAFISCLLLFFFLFMSIGGLIGYFSTPNTIDDIINKYSEFHQSFIAFDSDRITATYDLRTNDIDIEEHPTDIIDPRTSGFGNFCKAAIASASITSSIRVMEKSFAFLKYSSRYAKNKAGKIVIVAGYAGVALGTLCGANQGFEIGRRLKLERIHEDLLMQIKNPEHWQKVIDRIPSYYRIPNKYNKYLEENYTGIGISYTYNSDSTGIIVEKLMANGPAAQSSLQIGDLIYQVDSFTVHDNLDIASKIKGPKGTTVILGVKRNMETFSIKIVRDVIKNNQDIERDNSMNASAPTSEFHDTNLESIPIANPAVLYLTPIDNQCQAYEKGIHYRIIVLDFVSWNLNQEMIPEILSKKCLSDNNELIFPKTFIYGYWTQPTNVVEVPQFKIEKYDSENKNDGLIWNIEPLQRDAYNKYKQLYNDWIEAN